MMRRILLASALFLATSPAWGQNVNLNCFDASTARWTPCASANPLAVTAGSGGLGAVTIADGADVTQGAVADAAWTSGSGTVIALLKAVAGSAVTLGQTTMSASVPVAIASNQSNVPANVAAINAVTPLMGNGVTGTGSQRVTIASDNTAFTVNAAQSGTWTVITSSQYPSGAIPITASATGTTGATTATLAAHATKTTYICGLSIRANATAAATGNATVTGTVTGTLNFTQFTAPVATGIGITEPNLGSVCVPGSAANTAVAVVSAAPGTGGVISVTAWGYQL